LGFPSGTARACSSNSGSVSRNGLVPWRSISQDRRHGCAAFCTRGSPERWTASAAIVTPATGERPRDRNSPSVVDGVTSPRSRATWYSIPVTPLEMDPISKSLSSVVPSVAVRVPYGVTVATATTSCRLPSTARASAARPASPSTASVRGTLG